MVNRTELGRVGDKPAELGGQLEQTQDMLDCLASRISMDSWSSLEPLKLGQHIKARAEKCLLYWMAPEVVIAATTLQRAHESCVRIQSDIEEKPLQVSFIISMRPLFIMMTNHKSGSF